MISVNDHDHNPISPLADPTTPAGPTLSKYLSGVESTPASRGSEVVQSTTGADAGSQYVCQDYDGYIEEDMRTNRVFVDVMDFLETVLRIPKDWAKQTALGDDIKAVLQDANFREKLATYLENCKSTGLESRHYEPRVELYKRTFEILHARIFIKGLSPGLCPYAPAFRDKKNRHPQVLSFEEIKDTGIAIYDGQNAPCITRDDYDPQPSTTQPKDVAIGELSISVGAAVNNPSSQPDGDAATTQISQDIEPVKVCLMGKKRAAPENNISRNRKKQKVESTADAVSSNQQTTPKDMVNTQVQCARYAMGRLSLSLLRSHFIMTLCDLNRFQLQFYDRSVILVSSPVDIDTDDGQRLFVLMVWGLLRMTPEDLGFRAIIKGSNKFREDVDFYDSQVEKNWQSIFNGMRLSTPINSYTLGEVVFRQPGLIGRTTLVVRANGPEGPVVLKREEAGNVSQRRHSLALNHLANQHETLDLAPADDSIIARVAHFLNTAKYIDDKVFHYEDRVLRIDVYEELHPLNTLTTVEDIGQVFYDVLQIHKWLHDFPAILHRDISMGNIMYRKIGNRVFGVLNDLDLSSLLSDIISENATSLRRTGTPPYMAYELQMPSKSAIVPLYRHDLESLFYVFCALLTCYQFEKISVDGEDKDIIVGIHKRKDTEMAMWFDLKSSPTVVALVKESWFSGLKAPDFKKMITPEFQPFLRCLTQIQNLFFQGTFFRKSAAMKDKLNEFDEQTLGDMVTYAQFSKVMRAELPGPPMVRDD